MMTLVENLLLIQTRIAQYEKEYGRDPHSVTLIAASKGRSLAAMKKLYTAGVRAFGENYLQEALIKIKALQHKAIEWHFIGPIQRNKTRKIAENFAWVHSVDKKIIAKRLNDQRPAQLPPLNICIEVNINQEENKSGVLIDEVMPLLNYCLTLPNIIVRGLMAIPAQTINFQEQRNEFRQLFSVWKMIRDQGIPLDTLSMGMSDDFEAAIAEGSTLIRLGTALFGERI